MVDGDSEPVADEPGPVARDRVETLPRLLQQLVAHLRRGEAGRDEHHGEHCERRRGTPAPDQGGGRERARDQRGEARL